MDRLACLHLERRAHSRSTWAGALCAAATLATAEAGESSEPPSTVARSVVVGDGVSSADSWHRTRHRGPRTWSFSWTREVHSRLRSRCYVSSVSQHAQVQDTQISPWALQSLSSTKSALPVPCAHHLRVETSDGSGNRVSE